MSASLPVKFLEDGGNPEALLLIEEWDTVVRSHFENKTIFSNFEIPIVQRKRLGTGREFKFSKVADAPEPTNYKPGPERLGMSYGFTQGSITVDDYVTIHAAFGDDDMEDWQWEAMSPVAKKHGEAMATQMDKRGFIMWTEAARTAAENKTTADGDVLNVHPGGNVVERVGASGIASAYAATKTGAFNLRTDIDKALQLAYEDDAPEGDVWAVMPYYLKTVLAKDDAIFNKNLSNSMNDLVGHEIYEVSGAKILFTNNLPSTQIGPFDLGGNATIPLATKYQGDYRYNGSIGQPVVLMAWGGLENNAPVGLVEKEGVRSTVSYESKRSTTFIDSIYRYGLGVLMPSSAVEIRVKAS